VLCPFDATTLQAVNRSGVEIDWCPSCKGVWLERGELDKLIDQADAAASAPPAPRMPAPVPPAPYPDQRGGDARYTDPRYTDPRYADRRRDRDDDDDDDDRRRYVGDGYRDGDGYRPKKRKNLLSEIFDF
jgi:uncharacterized protein